MFVMNTQDLPDDEIFALFKSGDRRGFELLFNRYWQEIHTLSSRILEDPELAKDVVQEVFISVYENRETSDIKNIRGYLFQAVKYRCFMHLRSGKISERHLLRMNTVIVGNAVEEQMDANELEVILREGMQALPEKCREVFYLSRYEFQSNKSIARQLNISTKTVEHQITKALKTLRISMDKFAILILTAINF
jgi:RNA polymerase sigma-70 factor (family 1)